MHLAYLARPAADRTLYRLLDRRPVRHIAEIGLRDGTRAERLLQMAARHTPVDELQYTGVDPFELRPEATGLSLKEAYRRLRATGARVRLAPGDPAAALEQAANSIQNVDLLVIAWDSGLVEPGPAWFYVPRMLHARSLVVVEDRVAAGYKLRRLPPAEIATRAERPHLRRAA